MPYYDYQCENCDYVMPDVEQRISEDPLLLECPLCKYSLKRKIGPTSFVLKGSGWADTGYSSSSPAKKKD